MGNSADGTAVTAFTDTVDTLEAPKNTGPIPINLGIKKLKRELKALYPDMVKSTFNNIIQAYKKRSWAEYEGVMRHRGTFPTHPSYKTAGVDITTTDEEITTIKVKNGKQK